jgi:hypothetical protein
MCGKNIVSTSTIAFTMPQKDVQGLFKHFKKGEKENSMP